MAKPKIFVAGHKGMVGSALVRFLKKKKEGAIILKNRSELDLTNQKLVINFLKKEKVDQIYLAAAKVGGIFANHSKPADFIYENLMIQSNIIHSAFLSGVKKLLFLGSSCIYPKNTKQPMREEQLLSGVFEPTNEPYAIAKVAGIKLCDSYNRQYGISHNIDYRSVMPTNLYGPNDNYNLDESHVLPALLRKFHEAKIYKKPYVTVWGTGKPKREFLHVDDLANACHLIMNINKKKLDKHLSTSISHLNIGYGSDLSIKDLAKKIQKITGFEGRIKWDKSKPDGTKRKLLNCSRIFKLGWRPKISLQKGLKKVYENFKKEFLNVN